MPTTSFCPGRRSRRHPAAWRGANAARKAGSVGRRYGDGLRTRAPVELDAGVEAGVEAGLESELVEVEVGLEVVAEDDK